MVHFMITKNYKFIQNVVVGQYVFSLKKRIDKCIKGSET